MDADHLVQLAADLAEINPRRPRRTDLCRAVSTTYYAMFHCLAQTCAVPPGTEPLEVSDWHRRHGRANATIPNMDRIAQARVVPVPTRPPDDR